MSSADQKLVFHVPRGIFNLLLTLLLLFGVLEIGQRIYDHLSWERHARDVYSVRGETAGGQKFNDRGGSIVLRHHPYLVYEAKPSQKRPGVTVNAQGFRGSDWMMDKAPGSQRIIVIGGSAAFGQGVSADDKVFTAVLERMMKSSPLFVGRTVEVYNAGVLGYNSTQEYLLFATRLVQYAPDVIILYNGWNDLYIGGTLPPDIKEPFHPIFYGFDRLLARNGRPLSYIPRGSAIFRMIERKISKWHRPDAQRKFGAYSDNKDVVLPRYRLNLKRVCRLARAYQIEVVLAPQPDVFQRSGVIPSAEQEIRRKAKADGYAELSQSQYPLIVETARQIASAEGAIFVDFDGVFDDTSEVVFVDSVHLNDRGNGLIARRILPVVERILASPMLTHNGSGRHPHSRSMGEADYVSAWVK